MLIGKAGGQVGGVGIFHLASSWRMAKPLGPCRAFKAVEMSLPKGPLRGTQGARTVPRPTRWPCCPSKPATPTFVQSRLRLAQLPTALSLSPRGPSAFCLRVPLCHPSLLPLVPPLFSVALPSLSLSHHFSLGTHLSLPLFSQFSPSHLLFTLPSSFSLSVSSLFSFFHLL